MRISDWSQTCALPIYCCVSLRSEISRPRLRGRSASRRQLQHPACCLHGMPVAVDDETLEDALDVVAGFAEGDALDPVDRIDSRVTRIAVMLDPVSRAAWPGVVGGQRQDVGAAELTQQLLEIRLAEPGVVVGGIGRAHV